MTALHPYVLSPPESKRIHQQRRMPCLLSCQLNTSRSYDSRVYRASQILCYIVHTAPAPVDLRVWSSDVLIYGWLMSHSGQKKQLFGPSPMWVHMCGETVQSNERCWAQITPACLHATVSLHMSEVARDARKLSTEQHTLSCFIPMWTRLWFVRLASCFNALLQTSHLCTVTDLCVLSGGELQSDDWAEWTPCYTRHICTASHLCVCGGEPSDYRSWVNVLPQTSQLYGLSSVCMRRWAVRWLSRMNALLHTSQLYGLSSVCMRRWARQMTELKWTPCHRHHSYTVSHLCVCGGDAVIWLSRVNALSQTSQLYGLSSVCIRRWFVRVPSWVNALPQTSQL